MAWLLSRSPLLSQKLIERSPPHSGPAVPSSGEKRVTVPHADSRLAAAVETKDVEEPVTAPSIPDDGDEDLVTDSKLAPVTH